MTSSARTHRIVIVIGAMIAAALAIATVWAVLVAITPGEGSIWMQGTILVMIFAVLIYLAVFAVGWIISGAFRE